MKFLLDTCTVSDFFKQVPSTIKRFKQTSSRNLAISAITVMEIEYGLNINESRATKIRPLWDMFLEEIFVFPFREDEASSTALLRKHLRKQTIGAWDIMIAGTAFAHDLCIVTSNMSEFGRLDSLIKIENWRVQ